MKIKILFCLLLALCAVTTAYAETPPHPVASRIGAKGLEYEDYMSNAFGGGNPIVTISKQVVVDYQCIPNPGNPPAGNIRIYCDSGTGNLTCLTSAGGSCSGSTAPSGGTPGQVLVSNGASPGTYQDPNVSNTPMVLLSAVAATGTQTGSGVKIPLQSTSGTLAITGAGITGSPSGCTIALEVQQSTGTVASSAIATQAFTPSTAYQSFGIVPSSVFAGGDNLIALYACSVYPGAGTITVTFAPANTATLSGNGGVSNGQWVTTSDVLWTQYTSPGSTLYPGLATAQILSAYRILQPNGTLTNGQWTTTTCNMASNGGYGIGIQVPVNGWLQSYTTYMTTGGVSQGTIYANLYVLPSMPSGGSQGTCSVSLAAANFGTLLAGAPTGSFYPVGFVGTTANIVSPWAIPAPAVNQAISNPSAGAEFQATLGTQTRTCVTGLSFALTTSATVANRTVSIRMIQPASTGTQLIYIASITQPASTAVVYSFSPGTLAQQQTFGASILQTVPFTNGAPVCFNGASTGTIGSLTSNIQAGDQYSSINLALTQLPDVD